MRRARTKFGIAHLSRGAVLLVGGAIVLLLLPTSWTRWTINLVQPLIPFQRAVKGVESSLGDTSGDGGAVPKEQFLVSQRERAAMEHTAASLTARVDELEGEVDALTATRDRQVGGRRIGARGRLLPAKVLGEDTVSWRESRLLDVGSSHGVQRGADVISAHFTVDAGEEAGLRNGLAILRGEVLIGWIEQVGTHSSRVRLNSDPATQVKVRIARNLDQGFSLADRYFWLRGMGKGRMEIRDVERRDVDAQIVRAGDLVLSDPMSELLPTAMTIGRVTSISADRDNPLFSILTVESEAAIDGLRRVYVYDPREEAESN